jgi:small subunit ribosomal protein S8
MVNDHLSDMIARINNGYRSGAVLVEIPTTKSVAEVLRVMSEEGYVGQVENKEDKLLVTLKYKGRDRAIMGIKRVSKPGVRRYSGSISQPKVWGGLGINILSTNLGIMSGKKAKKVKVGGEIICQIW